MKKPITIGVIATFLVTSAVILILMGGLTYIGYLFYDPVIVAVGDIACDPSSKYFNNGEGTATKCRQMSTSNIAKSINPNVILFLGDIQYEKGTYDNFLQSFDPSWGRMKSIIYPSPGNHDYVVKGAEGYYDYFGDITGDRTKGYYSFDIESWHFISLNSNCLDVSCNSTSAQAQWLENDLASDDSQCTLAYWHHPRFNAGKYGEMVKMDYFWQLLDEHNVEVALAGHEHNYQRFTPVDSSGTPDPQGVRQFVVGTGGKDHYEVKSPFPSILEKFDDSTFGVLKMTLHDTSYEWEFVGESGSSFTDSGIGYCN